MTILQFIKSKLDQDTPEGDLARDAYKDKSFRALRTDAERKNHLQFNKAGIAHIVESFFEEFNEINSK
ncbi:MULTISPECIES: hypothetical protein [unclassified Flavobacterium]|uniref:hypothetical protein n=1 Tax=unclassified Flavobacterium TaxID=196869 RepID=UPI00115FEBDB|nr:MULTISPECIES: hypothetical protein [unclassified Flavobacterium]